MDSLTQIVLGAGVAEVVLGRKAGNRAPLWGAIAGTIPDLDVIPGQWMSTVDALAFHRGISHSLLFAMALAPLLSLLAKRIHGPARGNFRQWTGLFFAVLFTHSLLDCFTTWGVQLFWPLDHRIAWKSIFVVDPFYTLPFMVCLIWTMTKKRKSTFRRKLAWAGLVISTLYLVLTVINKWRVNQVFEAAFARQNIEVLRFDSRPTPLQNVLWAVNAETKDAFYIGFYSFLDDDQQIEFQRFSKNQQLPPKLATHPQVEKLQGLTQGWYNIEQKDSTHWILNDFRFGQLGGYQQEASDFVFSYKLALNPQNEVIIEERETTSAEAGKELLGNLWRRILGEK